MHEFVQSNECEKTYRVLGSDSDAAAMVQTVIDRCPGATAHSDGVWAMRLLVHTKWLECGRVQLVAGEKYAAAMMSTSVSECLADSLIIPWKAFSVSLPPGLLSAGDISFERINVAAFSGLPFAGVLTLRGHRIDEPGGIVEYSRICNALEDIFLACETTAFMEGQPPIDDLESKERALCLAIRLVTGLLYTMQYTDNFQEKTFQGRPKSHKEHRGPPPHRVYIIGKPMTLDCRPSVREFMSGTRKSPPSVQSLVRGHFRRQVVGVGGHGRKVIWIEPFWRGPEEAPILARPYRITGGEA